MMKFKQWVNDNLKINLDVRFKNPQYWFMMGLAVIVPIVSYLGINLQDITSWKMLGDLLLQAISNPYLLALVVINVYNATIDPTTKGIKDSQLILNNKDSESLLIENSKIKEDLKQLNEELKKEDDDK